MIVIVLIGLICASTLQQYYMGSAQDLDQNPLLFFELRDLNGQELIRKSMEQKVENMLKNTGRKSKREINAGDIPDIFGL